MTYSLEVVQVDEDVAAHAVGDVLQDVHVLCLGGAGALRHVIVVVVVVGVGIGTAVQGQALELLCGLGRRRLEVLEEVDKGSCGCSARVRVLRACCAACFVYPPSCSS